MKTAVSWARASLRNDPQETLLWILIVFLFCVSGVVLVMLPGDAEQTSLEPLTPTTVDWRKYSDTSNGWTTSTVYPGPAVLDRWFPGYK